MDEINLLRRQVKDLERTNKELSIIFDSMDDLVFVIDSHNVIVRANAACAQFFNTNIENILGKKCYEAMHKMNSPWPSCPLEKTKEDHNTHVEEVDDPTIGIPLLVTTSPIFDENGNFIGAVHVAKNITNYKNTLKALRVSELKYKVIFESSSDAIMLLTPEGRFMSGNESAIKLYGCKDEKEFITYSPASLSPQYQPDGEPSESKARKMINIAVEKGSNFFEWAHKKNDGTEFFATVLLTRMELEGKVVLQATVRDITERKKNEEILKKKVEDLQRFQNVTIDRELKMKELKQKIAELEIKLKNR